MSIEKYPLQWPAAWPRTTTGQRTVAKFGKKVQSQNSSDTYKADLTVTQAVKRVLAELTTMGVHSGDVVISTNVPVTLDGMPRSGARMPDDPGAAVYWIRSGENAKVMAIDRYTKVADNLAAIAATLFAMRAIERHGGALILERAFAGFTALPAPGKTAGRGWREVLGFKPGTMVTLEDAEQAYRGARSAAHPDKNPGDPDAAARFQAVQEAWKQAQAELDMPA